jgi:endonuclease YncB( thermonuclease family)
MGDRLDADEASDNFKRHLKALEAKAQSQRLGVWSKKPGRKP